MLGKFQVQERVVTVRTLRNWSAGLLWDSRASLSAPLIPSPAALFSLTRLPSFLLSCHVLTAVCYLNAVRYTFFPLCCLSSAQSTSALVAVKGASVSIFPRITATATNTPSGGHQVAAAPAPASFAASPHHQQPPSTTWEAHDHNVTGISAFPFPAPVTSTAAAAGTTGASRGSGKGRAGSREEGGGESAAAGGGGGKKRRRKGEGGEFWAGVGPGAKTAAASDGWSIALIYTCSMDGSCKEWEVGVAGAGAGGDGDKERGKGAAKAR